jgi:hypothetical protein
MQVQAPSAIFISGLLFVSMDVEDQKIHVPRSHVSRQHGDSGVVVEHCLGVVLRPFVLFYYFFPLSEWSHYCGSFLGRIYQAHLGPRF